MPSFKLIFSKIQFLVKIFFRKVAVHVLDNSSEGHFFVAHVDVKKLKLVLMVIMRWYIMIKTDWLL